MYVYELTFPTFIMGWVVALVQRGAASMQRIDELLSERAVDRRPARRACRCRELRGEIEFRDLTFRYASDPAREPALRDVVAARARPAASLGVVGTGGRGQDHARLADPAPLRGAGRRSSSSTAST